MLSAQPQRTPPIFRRNGRHHQLQIKKAIAGSITSSAWQSEEDERLGGILEPVLEIQLKGGLKDLSPEEVANLVIAYEPVWAIGTGLTATSRKLRKPTPSSARLFPTSSAQTPPPRCASSTAAP